jgi:hypothetical protein
MLSRMLLVLVALAALATPPPPPAHAESPPPDELLRLNDRLIRARGVRVTTLSRVMVVGEARVGVEGLGYRNILSSTGEGPLTAPGIVPWDAAVRVDVRGNRALRTAVIGGLAVVVLAAGAVALTAGQDAGPGGGVIIYALPPVVLLGAGVGALIHGWSPVYRNRNLAARTR